MRFAIGALAVAVGFGVAHSAAPPRQTTGAGMPVRVRQILIQYCHRCHGQNGSVEGGMNYILDREMLVARRKVLPGAADRSPLYRKVAAGRMPPAGEKPRPGPAELVLLKRWINAGAPGVRRDAARETVTEAALYDLVLADLDKQERRARRFLRYFSLAPLANAGHGPDELHTYRNALAKLLNSLSWHPRVTLPKAIDPAGLVLRIDLRDFLWDANLWNRVLAEYPYGILHDTAVARAVLSATLTRVPVARADWFVATASRAPLYYELLQIPSNLSELERQLRVDAAADIQQERVARAGFNGSGVSKNNRVLERHVAMNGAYWRTYDFEAVPQNLIERNILLPDRRNLFAYPLGPGSSENNFQHAGGEVIFNLPNGLQGYVLVNANNVRVNKAPTAIVSDPKRPDRAVEAGLSCMNCHARGVIAKDDQIRDHVGKNKKAFSRADAELVRALYPPAKKMRALMEADAERFKKAVEKTGNKVTAAEVVMAMTLRYEADVDLATLAAELGLRPKDLLPRLARSENLVKNLGALKVPGATVARQVVAQAFGDLVKELRLGGVVAPGSSGESLPDATGEVDPLEAQSSPANAMAFSPDHTLAAFASADRSVRIYEVEGQRDLRRCVGHTASVWCVAFSPDGTRLLSGGKDGSVRLWDVATGRELKKLDGHADLVSAIAFSPDGKRALSAGYDQEVSLWDLEKGERVPGFACAEGAKYVNAVAFAPDGKRALTASGRTIYVIDAAGGKLLRRLEGHTGWVTCAAFSDYSRWVLSGADDGTARLWDAATGKQVRVFRGHDGYVKAVAFGPGGRQVLTGGTDATVRLWDAATGKELRAFRKHAEPLVAVAFLEGARQTVSGSRDGAVHFWTIPKLVRVRWLDKVPVPVAPSPGGAGPRPLAVIRVGGTVGAVLLSPDPQALYVHNRTDGTLGRVDTKTYRTERAVRLAEGSDVVCLSPDGKLLVAVGHGKGDKRDTSVVQVFDPVTLDLKKSFRVAAAAYDGAVSDAGLLYLSGASGDWTEIAVVDVSKGAVAATWGGVWARSFVGLTPDGRRLYHASQGVVPGTLDAVVVSAKFSERPATYRAPGHDKQALGGEFVISPDGRFLLCKTGAVLRLSAARDDDMKPHKKLAPFLAAAIDMAGGTAYILGREGELRRYAYPSFEPRGTHRLRLSGYRLAVDGKGGRLYVGGFDPAAVGDRPRARAHGDVHVYALRDFAAGR
jgi:WD40 repeat protein